MIAELHSPGIGCQINSQKNFWSIEKVVEILHELLF